MTWGSILVKNVAFLRQASEMPPCAYGGTTGVLVVCPMIGRTGAGGLVLDGFLAGTDV